MAEKKKQAQKNVHRNVLRKESSIRMKKKISIFLFTNYVSYKALETKKKIQTSRIQPDITIIK